MSDAERIHSCTGFAVPKPKRALERQLAVERDRIVCERVYFDTGTILSQIAA